MHAHLGSCAQVGRRAYLEEQSCEVFEFHLCFVAFNGIFQLGLFIKCNPFVGVLSYVAALFVFEPYSRFDYLEDVQ